MSVVMLIHGLINGSPTGFDNQWLVEYDPEREGLDDEGRPMFAHLRTTPDPSQARVFSDTGEAMALWKQVSKREPWRPDGKPNRPLSAFTVEIRNREEALREHAGSAR